MVSHGLLEQVWYWDDADKAVVSRALTDQPDGAFIVRNASTPGDYTLSVKYGGQVKLVKIVVREEKCGFSTDMLNHDSIVELVEFHKNVSLNIYNENLDVKLLYPVQVRRNSQLGRQLAKKAAQYQKNIFNAKTEQDWDERLGLESLRIAQMSCERAARLYDVAHSEVERAENLFHTLSNSVKDFEMKLERLLELADVEEKMSHKIDKTVSKMDESDVDNYKKAMDGNQKVLEEIIRRLKSELVLSQSQKTNVGTVLDEMKAEMAAAKARLVGCHDVRNRRYADLVSNGVAAFKLQTTVDATGEMILNEPMAVSVLLADLPNIWTPSHYLVFSSSKEEAASALLAARERVKGLDKGMGVSRPPIDGVFLIRPSASHSDKLVLSVLYGERISHCLIEQNEQGWGFEKSNIYLTTIGDFVRYYAHTSLDTHNDNIKTKLAMPAFADPDISQLSHLTQHSSTTS